MSLKIIRTRLFFKGFAGLAIKPFIFIHPDYETEELIRHERIHIAQQEELGLFRFLCLYLYYNIKVGYWNNPFEQEARAFQGQVGYLDEGLRRDGDWRYYLD